MPHTADQMLAAIREAYHLARLHRAKAAIITTPAGKLRAVTRALPGDTVLVRDITPPRWSDEITEAAHEAFREFENALPALRRMGEIIRSKSGGTRDPENQVEIVDEVIRRFVALNSIEMPPCPIAGPDPGRKAWGWTRIFSWR